MIRHRICGRTTKESFELLTRHPRIGRLRRFSVPGVRSWLIPDFQNYLIFYLPTGTEVQILAVLHGARDSRGGLRRSSAGDWAAWAGGKAGAPARAGRASGAQPKPGRGLGTVWGGENGQAGRLYYCGRPCG
jgi:plasmid stabilization system protein ParE